MYNIWWHLSLSFLVCVLFIIMNLWVYVFFQLWKLFSRYFFKYIFSPSLCLPSGTPFIAPQISETLLISFPSLFSLCLSYWVISLILLFISLSLSSIISCLLLSLSNEYLLMYLFVYLLIYWYILFPNVLVLLGIMGIMLGDYGSYLNVCFGSLL